MQTAGDLIGALDWIRQTNPDALVLDLNLPDSEGLATLRAVLASAPHVPVVVLTGLADVDVAHQALQLGAQDWLVKGQLDPDVVQRAVRYAVERKRLTERLVQAQKLEIAGRLANGVAHEFNNVLTAIASSAELVEDAVDAEARAERPGSAAPCRSAGHRAEPAAAVAGPQSASQRRRRVDGRPGRQRPGPGPGRAAIHDSTRGRSRRGRTGPPRSGAVRSTPPQPRPECQGRHARGRHLRISVTAEAAHSAAAEPDWVCRDPLYAVVRVSDTGVGIDPSITPRLFEPFFTTKGTTGTGLGLAVVAEIVDRFGGAIHVESRLGAGTTIAVSLPAASEPAEE